MRLRVPLKQPENNQSNVISINVFGVCLSVVGAPVACALSTRPLPRHALASPLCIPPPSPTHLDSTHKKNKSPFSTAAVHL